MYLLRYVLMPRSSMLDDTAVIFYHSPIFQPIIIITVTQVFHKRPFCIRFCILPYLACPIPECQIISWEKENWQKLDKSMQGLKPVQLDCRPFRPKIWNPWPKGQTNSERIKASSERSDEVYVILSYHSWSDYLAPERQQDWFKNASIKAKLMAKIPRL